jgi:hypothetical protein
LTPRSRRHGTTVKAQSFLPPRAQPHLQALEAIQPVHTLLIVRPALTPQHDPDAHVAEPWSGLRDLPDTHAQCGRITRL